MWTISSEQIHGGHGLRLVFQSGAAAVSYAEVLRLWQSDDEFRSLFLNVLADVPFNEFRWETPPITVKTSQRPFEFVLLEDPSSFIRDPDPDSFADQFASAAPGQMAVEFPNLGKDGILIAPCPLGPHPAYVHLAVFVRQAPAAQQHALWSLVGQAMQRRLSARPVWLSTAGGAVAWLHVRLDDRPKYYCYEPYRRPA